MSRRAVIWDGMGFPSARQGWMAALLASFLALFVLVSAIDPPPARPKVEARKAWRHRTWSSCQTRATVKVRARRILSPAPTVTAITAASRFRPLSTT